MVTVSKSQSTLRFVVVSATLCAAPACATLVAAQSAKLPFSLEIPVEGVSYAPEIPLPETVIGHRIGDGHTRPDQIVDYFEAVDRVSDRVITERHGLSYEGRPLVHAIVTSAENQRRLEAIRKANLCMSEEPGSISPGQLGEMPVIVMMGSGVHGNEASGGEAALLLLYHLAAGNGSAVEELLSKAVVIINPMLNPDGRARFVEWVNGNRGRVATTDPNDREHVEPWPGGRTNHYWFDLNRDWLTAQLIETKGRLELYHRWMPELQTDFHEMGSDATFFFQPGVPSRDNPNTPAATIALTRKVAAYHARRLDRIGSLYYSEESFDDFYYGKGSTYPDLNGAVGILFEQASSRALRRETAGGVLDYAFTIRNQFSAALSSLEAAKDLRLDLLDLQRNFYLTSADAFNGTTTKAYLIDLKGEGERGRLLAEILLRHQIRVHQPARELEVEGRRFSPGRAVIVPVDQPQARLLKTIMEPVTEFADSTFYDISTWALPPALGIQVGRFGENPAGLLGPRLRELPELVTETGATAETIETTVAWALRWDSYRAPYLLWALQEAGLQTRLMMRPFEVRDGGSRRSFDPGTVVVPAVQGARRAAETSAIVTKVSARFGLRLEPLSTGLTEVGPDLGGPSSLALKPPKVAILTGRGLSSGQAGEAWYFLNEVAGMPVSLVDVDRLPRLDCDRYNTVVLPSGIPQPNTDEVFRKLNEYVQKGGTLIALEDAVSWLVKKEMVKETLREWAAERQPVAYGETEKARIAETIPGTAFAVKLDLTHPLAFGLPERLAVMRDHEILIEKSQTPGAVVASYPDSPLVSGYIKADRVSQLAGTAAVVARRVGDGHLVLFLDDPIFRGYWYGSGAMFFNAVFFGSVF